ncbi:MAG: hypothetical protein CL607_04685 [Anaerolineaceae bacterium]|nr:hypothetical protein [Anaerolineaceae bacterium]
MPFRFTVLFLIAMFIAVPHTEASLPSSPICPAPDHSWCIVDEPIDPLVALTHLAGGQQAVWSDGDKLMFVYQGYAQQVWLHYSLQEPLRRMDNSDLWTLTVRIPELRQAVLSYKLVVDNQFTEGFDIWRGPDAPSPTPRVQQLQGTLHQIELFSTALEEKRSITVYLPPYYRDDQTYPVVYSADGQSVANFAHYVEAAILSKSLPSIILVGVHSSEYRAEEYLPGISQTRFEQHEAFFTQEVRQWVENHYAVSTQREDRIVFGYSNGGVFAAAMGLRHSDLYAHAFPFSPGMNPLRSLSNTVDPTVDYFVVAGTLEEGFHWNASEIVEQFSNAGAQVWFHTRVSGHDFIMWSELFIKALKATEL